MEATQCVNYNQQFRVGSATETGTANTAPLTHSQSLGPQVFTIDAQAWSAGERDDVENQEVA